MSNRSSALFCKVIVFFAALLGSTASAAMDAADRTMLLVARPDLTHPTYSSAVVLATPLPEGGYIGFMINMPTTTKLAEVFPGYEPLKTVSDPLYVGGSSGTKTLFALVERRSEQEDSMVQLTPQLFLAAEVKDMDRVIASEAHHARFFLGLTLWKPGQLTEELKAGYWYVLEPEAKLVMRKNTQGMWEELALRANKRDGGIEGVLSSISPQRSAKTRQE
jgi:putative transcriptional regulator